MYRSLDHRARSLRLPIGHAAIVTAVGFGVFGLCQHAEEHRVRAVVAYHHLGQCAIRDHAPGFCTALQVIPNALIAEHRNARKRGLGCPTSACRALLPAAGKGCRGVLQNDVIGPFLGVQNSRREWQLKLRQKDRIRERQVCSPFRSFSGSEYKKIGNVRFRALSGPPGCCGACLKRTGIGHLGNSAVRY